MTSYLFSTCRTPGIARVTNTAHKTSVCSETKDGRWTWGIASFSFWVTVCKTVRSMLSDRCLSCLLVYCGQTVGWIKTKLGKEVGLVPDHIVLDGDPVRNSPKGHSPQFWAHVCCGQMAGWIKMPHGREAGIGPGDIVLDRDPVPLPKKEAQQPPLQLVSIVTERLDVSRCP